MEEKKYNFVYQTKNLVNGKLYIGVHCTDDLNDGYIGCGIIRQSSTNSKNKTSPFIRAVKKHGYKNFSMVPMAFFDTKEEAYEEEAWIVTEEWVNRRDTYNVTTGGNINRQYKGSLTRDRHGFSKRVRNKVTGEVFDSITTVAEILGVSHSYLSDKLKGRCFNDTDYEFEENDSGSGRLKAPNNIKYVNIKRYDLQGNMIGEYKYLRDLDRNTRSNVLRSFSDPSFKVASGSLWRAQNIYTGEKVGFSEDIFKHFVYDLEGEYCTKFLVTTELMRFLGYSTNSSHRVLSKIKKGLPVKGYMIYDNKQKT